MIGQKGPFWQAAKLALHLSLLHILTVPSPCSPDREGDALQGDALQEVGGGALPQHARLEAARGRALRQLLARGQGGSDQRGVLPYSRVCL